MKELMKGNYALAEGALRGGMEVFAGYPITPATEIMEYLSHRMPELNLNFIQAENEISAINLIMGSYAGGSRSMTASSGPGISLKQEGISYCVANNLPLVFVNVIRWGVGLGLLNSAQTDYRRETGGGGHGDYRVIVLTPNSVQESVDLIYDAFYLAEKYRTPVELLTEASIGQMMEPCEMPPFRKLDSLDWAYTGSGKTFEEFGKKSPHGNPHAFVKFYTDKYQEITDNEQRFENYLVEDADYVMVAFGLPSRVVKDAVNRLREQGEKVGMIRPITIWPFPKSAFKLCKSEIKGFISIEATDRGMLIDDVALTTKKIFRNNIPVYGMFTSFELPRVKNIIEHFRLIKSGELKEVY